MKKEIISPDGVVSPPSPLSHVVKAGSFIFLSSQLSVNLKTHEILGGNIREQTKQALENIGFLLESTGSSMENIVKIVIYMKDVKKDFNAMNEVYRQYFREGQEPARVTIQALSPIEKIDIEIEATAIIHHGVGTVDSKAEGNSFYNNEFMQVAIDEAIKSEKEGGIPIGCVLVKKDKIISQAHNRRVQSKNPILHAEISCLEKALKEHTNLNDCVLFTTNMPCHLCAGAIIQFGVPKVIAGESKSFPNAQEVLELNGVEVINLDLEKCKERMEDFIQKNSHLWENVSQKNRPEIEKNDDDENNACFNKKS